MAELKTLLMLQETKFMVIDEDSKAMYADHLVAGYVCALKNSGSSIHHQIHLFLFIAPDCFYNHLLEIIGKDNLQVHDCFTPDINDLSKEYKIDLDSILKHNDIGKNSILIINCLSSLILTVGLAKAIKFIEKLASRVGQLICIFNRDICVEKFPCIETLGTTYVKLSKCQTTVINNDIAYEVSIIHRKKGGSIIKKKSLAIQDICTHEIKFDDLPTITPKLNVTSAEPTIKPQATFRTEMNARELEQRNKTPLPYTLNCNTSNESKILYVPDEVDDFDEEDPDDDLSF